MKTTTLPLSLRQHHGQRSLVGALALAVSALAVPAAHAQLTPAGVTPMIFMVKADLPDAPGVIAETPAASSSSSFANAAPLAFGDSPAQTMRMASHTDKYIEPGQPVPTLSVGNKFALGFKDAFSPFSLVSWAASAGYSQALNGSPNYGTNAEAFGKRFGASVARASSEGVFSDSVMGSVLREDPRYYRMGPGHNVLKRAAYAATRALITRTDSGRTTPNLALLSGNLAGSYLTKAYYPDLNTSNSEVLKTFGGSIGGSALGFVVSEFFGNVLSFHHDHD